MNIRAITVPYDSGRYRERMGRGPEQLVESGLKPLFSRLGHSLVCEEITYPEQHPAEIRTAFALCRQVADRVLACRKAASMPVVLSGNCNVAVGTIAGCGCEKTGAVWFDAHGESTTPETTASGFLDGMGISILTGRCWRKLAHSIPNFHPLPGGHVLLVGARDVEPDELALLKEVGVCQARGPEDLSSALELMLPAVDGVYLHIDLDVLDPSAAVANQWPVPDGLTLEGLKEAVRMIQTRTTLKGIGIASYDPTADQDGRALNAACSVLELLFGSVK